MDVKALEYLITIEQEGTVTKAAEKIHITQSALSQCLAKAEKDLGCPLFLRVDRRLVPTTAGRIYLDGASEIVAIKNELYAKIGLMVSDRRPQIRIAADPQIYFMMMEQWIAPLRKQFPGTHIKAMIADSETAKQYLLNNIADAAFFCIQHSDNALLNFYPLYEETLLLAVPASMALSADNASSLSACRNLPFILPRAGTFFRPPLSALLSSKGITPQSLYEAADFPEMKKLMELGYGVTFLPSRMAEASDRYQTYPLAPALHYRMTFVLPKYAETPTELNRLLEWCLAYGQDAGEISKQ